MNTALKNNYSEFSFSENVFSEASVSEASRSARNTKTTPKRMTEVIIPQGQNSSHIIFPLVASLSKQHTNNHRWLTWITDRKPNKQQLDSLGANTNTLRVIHIKKNADCRWIMWDALHTGNSHTVIADLEKMSSGDIKHMELAAENGECVGILARSI